MTLRRRPQAIVNVLLSASIIFYSVWEPVYLVLLSASIGTNYWLSQSMAPGTGTDRSRLKKLWAGIILNLVTLSYYKYAPIALGAFSWLSGQDLAVPSILLPLAISFFTLQQIAYLVDVYEGMVKPANDFKKFFLFVSFFPQLIAGPIVHMREIAPQLEWENQLKVSARFRAAGMLLFAMGLAKKVLIADQIQVYADLAYDAAAAGEIVTFVPAWCSALLYTFGLYFDFSGYSDMAVGLGMMFGVAIPFNFLSPYRATSIIQFWQRWHITLTQFITTYVYSSILRRLAKITFTKAMLVTSFSFLLVGLWHGPRWTYVIFGVLQGMLLVINHSWNRAKRTYKIKYNTSGFVPVFLGTFATFITVNICFVFFRADDVDAAFNLLKGMAGLNGATLNEYFMGRLGVLGVALEWLGLENTVAATRFFAGFREFYWIVLASLVVFTMPNSREVVDAFQKGNYDSWRYLGRFLAPKYESAVLGFTTGVMLILSLLGFTGVQEFIYFQF